MSERPARGTIMKPSDCKVLGTSRRSRESFIRPTAAVLAFAAVAWAPKIALADEGGVSFWIPGFFGSLAAAPQQPGWSLTTFYYHTSVSAGAEVALARERTLGNIPVNLNLKRNLSANLSARADLGLMALSYVLPVPVLGGQSSFILLGSYGRVDTSLGAQLNGTLSAAVAGVPLGAIPFSRSDNINSVIWGFGDLIPMFTQRWNAGVNNYMVYLTGDIPVGAYDPSRLSNVGIGHGAIDA